MNPSPKRLIVNADDCNLTTGVTEAILAAHQKGIVSSTTFLINLPCDPQIVKKLLKQKHLGIGLHLNITLGKPLCPVSRIESLVKEDAFKRKPVDVKAGHVYLEYEKQIRLFRKVFGKMPTHLDTHHQLHDLPFFMRIVSELAGIYRLPVRRSSLMNTKKKQNLNLGLKPLKTTDFFFGDLNPEGYWRLPRLKAVIQNLPEGLSEIMCHPGKVDRHLRKLSSFTAGRANELKVFCSVQILKAVQKQRIKLTHYGLCYT